MLRSGSSCDERSGSNGLQPSSADLHLVASWLHEDGLEMHGGEVLAFFGQCFWILEMTHRRLPCAIEDGCRGLANLLRPWGGNGPKGPFSPPSLSFDRVGYGPWHLSTTTGPCRGRKVTPSAHFGAGNNGSLTPDMLWPAISFGIQLQMPPILQLHNSNQLPQLSDTF